MLRAGAVAGFDLVDGQPWTPFPSSASISPATPASATSGLGAPAPLAENKPTPGPSFLCLAGLWESLVGSPDCFVVSECSVVPPEHRVASNSWSNMLYHCSAGLKVQLKNPSRCHLPPHKLLQNGTYADIRGITTQSQGGARVRMGQQGFDRSNKILRQVNVQ